MMKSKKVLREILADGGAVVLPTETVYGLFAKAMDESAVNHVYELKNRPRDKAMNKTRYLHKKQHSNSWLYLWDDFLAHKHGQQLAHLKP